MPILAGLALTLVLLLVHSWHYRFLTDDAFISFRYAKNLAEGWGLVFNPGFERVEGYTNFLWVLILAALHAVRIPPEVGANLVSLGLTVVLWSLVVRRAWRDFASTPAPWLVLTAPLLLAATRSVAVWATSGLETRLFEVLVVAGVLKLILELERGRTPGPGTAALFGLATLARPDGLLISVSCAAIAGVVAVRGGRPEIRRAVSGVGVFGLIVGSHLLFRRAYYGEWLPNTFFVKIGEPWWEMGRTFAATFVLEYAAYLWLPLILVGVWGRIRHGSWYVSGLYAAAVVPHAIYVMRIGGDHFEYRPLDLYLPFLYLLVSDGVRWLAASRLRIALVSAYVGLVLYGVVALPLASHRQFPRTYLTGFPGAQPDSVEVAASYMTEDRPLLYRLPVLSGLADRFASGLQRLTAHFVGLRQEEHALFLTTVEPEGKRLAQLVREGRIPADAHLGMHCVGAIPYFSGLRTMDRLGLTDRDVARSGALIADRLMAHQRLATLEQGRAKGVDLWALDPVNLLHRADDLFFLQALWNAFRTGYPAAIARIGEGEYLLAALPAGYAATAPRFPDLGLRYLRTANEMAGFQQEIRSVLEREAAARPEQESLRRALELLTRQEAALRQARGGPGAGRPPARSTPPGIRD